MSLLLFELMEWSFDCYMDEKALYVSFILTAHQNSQLQKNQEMKDFIRFIKDQNDILSALGIEIAVPPGDNTS
jgi:lipoate-protein ligase A